MVKRRRYHGALEFLPRLALAALAANLSLLFAGFYIDLNNALCAGIGAASLPGYGQFGQIGSLGQDMALLLLTLIYGVVGVLLVLQMLLRLALLDLLIITGPLGLVCWALPQTQAWAQLWTSTFVATTLVPCQPRESSTMSGARGKAIRGGLVDVGWRAFLYLCALLGTNRRGCLPPATH